MFKLSILFVFLQPLLLLLKPSQGTLTCVDKLFSRSSAVRFLPDAIRRVYSPALNDADYNDIASLEATTGRKLQDICSIIQSSIASGDDDYNFQYVCNNCATNNDTLTVDCLASSVCCGQYCANANSFASAQEVNGNVSSINVTYCLEFTKGLNETRCISAEYCLDTNNICGCSLTIDGTSCAKCEICNGDLNAPANAGINTYDCSNIANHRDLVLSKCVPDTQFEVMDCSNSTNHNNTDDSFDDNVDDSTGGASSGASGSSSGSKSGSSSGGTSGGSTNGNSPSTSGSQSNGNAGGSTGSSSAESFHGKLITTVVLALLCCLV